MLQTKRTMGYAVSFIERAAIRGRDVPDWSRD
jgi:hypothetical protein